MRSSKKRAKIEGIGIGATSLILRYLEENGDSEFGMLKKYVNSYLDDGGYSREGLAYKLKKLILEGKVARRKYKQGHYLYYLTKKGQENIELISNIFRDFSYDLLQEQFPSTRIPKRKEDYVRRTIERIGVYMLFSYIFGIINYTSSKNKMRTNYDNMKEWERGINPSKQIGQYLFDISRNFIKFDDYQEVIFSDMFDKSSFYDLLHDYFEKIKDAYPNEYQFLIDSANNLKWHIEDERFNKLSNKEKIKESRERLKRKL
ncbi:Hypothetical protein Nlim_1302 [Candidatus Nitrosarchaeum limnium SFB1]|jgi:DNA-binding HxlR family transcriptional regulator|uniref:Uncharacterized protein n=1 Tax=Candidatus Nitrosarchaeum limnium SFB1 TaxID=886738 RepID=F3KLC3_9ARCH|nr:Hypothetical protein Nlim_1302 [Candidatus Nitrosarchaeum limnium SFB1]